jgi:hypothetical protein
MGATAPASASSDGRCCLFMRIHPLPDPCPKRAGFIGRLALQLCHAQTEPDGVDMLHPLHHDGSEHAKQRQRPAGVCYPSAAAGRAGVEHERIRTVEPSERG